MDTAGASVSPTRGRFEDTRISPLAPRYRNEFPAAASAASRALSPDVTGAGVVATTRGGMSGSRLSPRGFSIVWTVYSLFSYTVNASLSAPRDQVIAGLYSVMPLTPPSTLVIW